LIIIKTTPMFKTIGRIKSKNLLKSGVSEKGEWKLMEFTIQKTFNREPIEVAFVAIGKMAELVDRYKKGKKVVIYFFPKCKNWKGKWYTELKVLEIEDYVKKPKFIPDAPKEAQFGSAVGAGESVVDEKGIGAVELIAETVKGKKEAQISPSHQDLPFTEAEVLEGSGESEDNAQPSEREQYEKRGKKKRNSPF